MTKVRSLLMRGRVYGSVALGLLLFVAFVLLLAEFFWTCLFSWSLDWQLCVQEHSVHSPICSQYQNPHWFQSWPYDGRSTVWALVLGFFMAWFVLTGAYIVHCMFSALDPFEVKR